MKEDGFLIVFGVAWLAFIAFGERWRAAALAGLALIYGAVVNVWLMPHFRGDDLNPLAERYGYLGDTVPEILLALVTEPGLWMKQLVEGGGIAAAILLLAGVAFIPLLAPRLWPCLLLVLIPPLLSQHPDQPELELHYMLVPATVALVVAAVVLHDNPRWLRTNRFPAIATGGLLVGPVVLSLWQSPFPPSLAANADQFDVDHHAKVSESMLSEIPAGAVVSAQSAFVPHLAERIHIYQFPRVLNAEFVLVDEYGPLPPNDLAAGYHECLEALPLLGFDKSREEDGITLWVKQRQAEPVPWVPEPCSGQPE